jgi:ribosome-associated translation inhibitor RaiA
MVVAADDGVMPQTREHAAVLRALAVETGVVAVTRCDLADPAEATAQAREHLSRGALADIPTVHVSGRTGNILKAAQSATHMNEAIDLVIEKMDRQIREHKEKLKDHKHVKSLSTAAGEPFPHPSTNPTPARANGVARVKRFKLKPITEDQAREQMDELGHDFYLFLNEDSQEVNVLYRRQDGSLGLLEADLT